MNPNDIPWIEQKLLTQNFYSEVEPSLPSGISQDCIDALGIWESSTSSNRPYTLAGMDAFYKKDWNRSLELLTSALEYEQWHPRTALGIGRLATRFGLWSIATDWILYAIQSSCEQCNDYNLMQCHGAMGELLLRAGHPKESLRHMQLAFALAPLGHPSRQLQYNFIAMPLARLGKPEVAEAYFMNASLLAKKPLDKMHALVRRAALILQDYDVPLDKIRGEFNELKSQVRLSNNSMVQNLKDYFSIILYWHDWNRGRTVNREQLLNLFEGYPLESHVISVLNGSQSEQITLAFPPLPKNISDPMEIKELSWNASVSVPIDTPESLRTHLRMFFI